MTAVSVPPPDFTNPWTDARGFPTRTAMAWIGAIDARSGQRFDKIDQAHATALAAAPQATQVIAGGGLQGGASLTGDVGLALYRAVATLASLPTTALSDGDWAYAQDGCKPGESTGAGSGVPCFWSTVAGTGGWYAVTSGALATA